MKRETWNVMQLGLGLCLIYFAFTSQGFIVETVLSDRHKEDPSIHEHAGYYSQTIVYAFYILSTTIAPPVVKLLTPKWGLVLGSTAYTFYNIGYLFLNSYYLYASAALEGLLTGVMWTSIGEYMARNSREKNIGRNSGIVWMAYASSSIWGGIFMAYMFENTGTTFISETLMKQLYGTFAGVSFIGNIVLALLQQKPAPEHQITEEDEKLALDKDISEPSAVINNEEECLSHYLLEMKKSWKLLWTIDILMLLPLYAFTGMQLSLMSTVYSTALSFTSHFTINTNVLMALNSISVGVGSLAAGIPYVFLSKRMHVFGHTSTIILATVAAVAAYLLGFLMLPGNASFERTSATSYIEPSIPLALLGGALLGFTDACINMELYCFQTTRFAGKTTQVFALQELFHALFASITMYYGSILQLQWQLGLLTIVVLISVVSFGRMEKRFYSKKELVKQVEC